MRCYFYPNKPIGHTINNIMGRLGWTHAESPEQADIYFWWKFSAEEESLPDILTDKPCVN